MPRPETPRYQGRLWDAPATDNAVLDPEYFVGHECTFCEEPIAPGDDALWMPHIMGHTECLIRSWLGDVQHLERRCLCFRGQGNEITYDSDHHLNYREGAMVALHWLLDHKQGRFHP